MMELKLRPRTLADGSLVLELGNGFRVLFAVLAGVVALGMVTARAVAPVPLAALVLLSVGAMYMERWHVDVGAAVVTAQLGLLPLHRTRRWAIGDLEAVEFTHYRAGSIPGSPQPDPAQPDTSLDSSRGARVFRRHFLVYNLATRDGSAVRVEVRRIRNWEEDRAVPERLAAALNVPLRQV